MRVKANPGERTRVYAWLCVDRLLGAHGIPHESPSASRAEFQLRMEALSKFDAEEQDEATLQAIRQSWSFGSEEFKIELLQRLEGELGERHSGQLHQQSSSARAERIIAEELTRLGWTESDLSSKRKNDPGKLALAARLRKETTQPSNKLPPALASARPRVRTQTCIKRSATSVTIGI